MKIIQPLMKISRIMPLQSESKIFMIHLFNNLDHCKGSSTSSTKNMAYLLIF